MTVGRRMVVVWAVAIAATGLAACGRSDGDAARPAPRDFIGEWIGDTLPAVAVPGRVPWLRVRPDSQAEFLIEYLGRGIVRHPGYWHARGRELTFLPSNADGKLYAPPLVWRLDGARLQPVRWDKELYGDAGMMLRRGTPPPAAAPAADSGTGGTR